MMESQLIAPLKYEVEEWPKHWPDWVGSALDELEHIERRFPKDALSGAPRWADKMGLRIIQMMHPTIKNQSRNIRPCVSGQYYGAFNVACCQ